MIKKIIVGLLFFVSSVSHAAEIKDVELYLNKIKTFKAGFLQLDTNNNLLEGTILIAKPGKFKWDYATQPIQIISDGKTVLFYDKELKQSSFLNIEDSIASLLAEADIDIKRDLNVLSFVTNAQGTVLTVAKPNKKDVKEMSLYFTNEPFALTRIDVLDYNGNRIEINLFDVVVNKAISNSEFIIQDQRFN